MTSSSAPRCSTAWADVRGVARRESDDFGTVTTQRRQPDDLAAADRLIRAWRTNDRATRYLIEHLPADIWDCEVPGIPRLTVRHVATHLHNSRCRWIKSLGRGRGIAVPALLDLRRARQPQLVRALLRSSAGIIALMRLGAASGGSVPRATWQNFPTDLAHFLSYFVAHEAHHRGQLILVARQLGHRLPKEVTEGVWQWTRRSREV
jgi:uncharacterized damage-inducible protein DinB